MVLKNWYKVKTAKTVNEWMSKLNDKLIGIYKTNNSDPNYKWILKSNDYFGLNRYFKSKFLAYQFAKSFMRKH